MTSARKLDILQRDEYTCYLCGNPLFIGHVDRRYMATVDHFVPVSHWNPTRDNPKYRKMSSEDKLKYRQEKNLVSNLYSCCAACNEDKQNCMPQKYFNWLEHNSVDIKLTNPSDIVLRGTKSCTVSMVTILKMPLSIVMTKLSIALVKLFSSLSQDQSTVSEY